jgi:hypothetical protein
MTEGSPDKAGRRLILATLSGGAGDPSYRPLHLDPAVYNVYLCNAAVVWGVMFDPRAGDSIVAKDAFNYVGKVDYERVAATPTTAPASAPVTGTVVLPGVDGTVVDFGHRSDLLLMAAYGPSVDNKTNSVLYAARGDGSRALPIYWTTGTLVSAALSPDDRYALVVDAQAQQDPAGKAIVSALLLALDDTGSGPPPRPVTIRQITMGGVYSGADLGTAVAGRLSISAVFLEKGMFANKLLLAWYDGSPAGTTRIRLVDVAHPLEALCETGIDLDNQGFLPVLEQANGRTLLLFNEGFDLMGGASKPREIDLRMLQADTRTDGATETTTVTARSYQMLLPEWDSTSGSFPYLSNIMLHGNSLIYQIETYDYSSGRITYKTYEIPVASAQGPAAQPTLLAGITLRPAVPDGQDVALGGVMGAAAYAYRDAQGTLHARAYDADVDVPLDKGVGAIVKLNATTYYKVLH